MQIEVVIGNIDQQSDVDALANSVDVNMHCLMGW
jgi:hypothetical protein